MAIQIDPKQAMLLAISEARKGAGRVSPNPLVGSVVVDENHNLVSSGYHKLYGKDHAEVDALKKISQEKIKNYTMYVTLEPCSHDGRTPSCARTLANLKLKKVIYGLKDPNPKVSGRGIKILRKAGIEVEKFKGLEYELKELVEIFFYNKKFNRPFVALKIASSIDGKIANTLGDSKWITNDKARYYAHYLRGSYDSILVGVNTIKKDNPYLNVRHRQFTNKHNKVIILDPDAYCIKKYKSLNFFKVHKLENIYLVVANKKRSKNKIVIPKSLTRLNILNYPIKKGKFDLDFIMDEIYKDRICSVLVEGGAFTSGSFLQINIPQRLYLFQSPLIIGDGLSWSEKLQLADLTSTKKIKNVSIKNFENNWLISGIF